MFIFGRAYSAFLGGTQTLFLSILCPTALLEGIKTVITSKTILKYALFQNIKADWDCKSAYKTISIILIFISESTFHTQIQILHGFREGGDKKGE
jgi:hypothetical protein